MALRNNKAANLNRYMMFGMFFLGIIVLGCVFGFMYLSFNKEDNPLKQNTDSVVDSIQNGSPSIILEISDSTLLDSL